MFELIFPRQQLQAFFLFVSLLALNFPNHVIANQKPLPTPLDIETALSFAKDHPRSKLKQNLEPNHQAPIPLFLGCHNLSFNNVSTFDPFRNSISTHLVEPVIRQKLFILQAYFDVLLADLSLISINEDMAGAFISFDRAKTRQELKQFSELKVAKLEAEYQEVRQQNFSAQATQRLTRSILAQAINHPDDLSSDLNPPPLITPLKKQPEADELYQQALKNNPWLIKLKSNSDNNQIALLEMNLRQQILELTLRLNVLNAARVKAESEAYRRDLNLDLSRTLYEMEVKATLGRSMTLQSKAKMEEERVKYCQTLTWAQLNALTGLPILTQPNEPVETN